MIATDDNNPIVIGDGPNSTIVHVGTVAIEWHYGDTPTSEDFTRAVLDYLNED